MMQFSLHWGKYFFSTPTSIYSTKHSCCGQKRLGEMFSPMLIESKIDGCAKCQTTTLRRTTSSLMKLPNN